MNDNAHILVVDDDRLIRLQLSQALKQQGFVTTEAQDGLQALSALDSDSFDLVILDIQMPNLDGFGVLERMKQRGMLEDTPVVVVSALDEMDAIVKCIRIGAEDYLMKPLERTLLDARVHACIEKRQLRKTVIEQLGRYVPESVAEGIIRDHRTLEPKRILATILFSDIEDFTGIAERHSPEHVFRMLNEYFPALVDPIMRHGGVVNQFQGDAMLVTFNVPSEDPMHADNAVRAALAIQKVVNEQTFAGVSVRTRVGINTGPVIAGNVGSGNRYTYTVHGDAVNSAARLERLNKEFKTYTLISASTVERLHGHYDLVDIGQVKIRGKQEAVSVFTLGQTAQPRPSS